MDILIVSQYFWPENFRINDLAQEFSLRGHSVTVLTGMPNYPTGKFFHGYSYRGPWNEIHEGVRIIRSPLILRGKGGGGRLVCNYLSFSVFASFCILLRARKPYDIIFVYEPSPITVAIPAIVLKWFTRSPILLWVLDLWPESVSATRAIRSKNILRVIAKLVQYIYLSCDRILIQSQSFRSSIEQLGVPAKKVLYFPSWAESVYDSVGGEGQTPYSGKFPSGFCIMFAGNIGTAQDFPTILDAAEHLKYRTDIHWVILGDGRRYEWVENEIQRRNLQEHVHLLGRYPLDAMPGFYSRADAMLVTLRRDPIFALTIPGKVQSYLAAGRPIVAALDGEGARIIREAGAGKVCASEDPVALADIVLEMVETSLDVREQMGRNGAEFAASQFDRETLLDLLESWFQEVSVPPTSAAKHSTGNKK